VARAADPDLSLQEAAELLGVHYMTVYRYVRTGKLQASKNGAQWRVRRRDVETLRRGDRAAQAGRGASSTVKARAGLEARMLAGDNAGAWQIVEGKLAGGLDPSGALTDLVVPVMRSVGDRWARGELTVADEHRATAVAQKVVGRLGLQFGRRGRRRGAVVLAAPAGDLHTLPVAIAADLLRWRGFNVVELGAHTPAAAIGEAAARTGQLRAVGIVSTTAGLNGAIGEAVTAVKTAAPGVPVLLGGGAMSRSTARRLAADLYTGTDADALVAAIEAITDERRP
jgi:excisionase family DNA binding protein